MGVGLTLALLTSLLVGAAPTPASATALFPYEESNYPKIVSEFLRPGMDAVDMAVNGDTVYVASGTVNLLFKSVDGGKTWNDMGTTTDYPTGVAINKVAVAPDNKNIVAMVTANYDRKGHRFVELDGLVVANATTPIARVAHTAIYRPRAIAATP